MNQDDFKKLLENALEPIKKQIEDPDTGLNAINKQLNDPDTGLKRINDKLDALSGDIEQLHDDVKGIRDKEGMAHLPIIPDIHEL